MKMERFAVGDRVRMVHPLLLKNINDHDECIKKDRLVVGKIYTVSLIGNETRFCPCTVRLDGKEWCHPACLFRKVK